MGSFWDKSCRVSTSSPVLCVSGSFQDVHFFDPTSPDIVRRGSYRTRMHWCRRVRLLEMDPEPIIAVSFGLYYPTDRSSPVEIVNLSSQRTERVFSGVHHGDIFGLANIAGTDFFVTGSERSCVSVSNWRSGGVIAQFMRPPKETICITHDPNSNHVFVGGTDVLNSRICLRAYDLTKASMETPPISDDYLSGAAYDIRGICCLQDPCEAIVSCSSSSQIHLWSNRTGTVVRQGQIHGGTYSIYSAEDLHCLFVGQQNGTIAVLDPRNLSAPIRMIVGQGPGYGPVFDIARISTKKFTSVTAAHGQNVSVWTSDGAEVSTTSCLLHSTPDSRCYGVCVIGGPEFAGDSPFLGVRVPPAQDDQIEERLEFLLSRNLEEYRMYIVVLGASRRRVVLFSSFILEV